MELLKGLFKTKEQKEKEKEEKKQKIETEKQGITDNIVTEVVYADAGHPLLKKAKITVKVPFRYTWWYLSEFRLAGIKTVYNADIRGIFKEVSKNPEDGMNAVTYEMIIQTGLAYELVITIAGKRAHHDIVRLI